MFQRLILLLRNRRWEGKGKRRKANERELEKWRYHGIKWLGNGRGDSGASFP